MTSSRRTSALAGLSLTLLCLVAGWLGIGSGGPAWLLGAATGLSFAPLFAVVAIGVTWMTGDRSVRPLAFAAGALAPYALCMAALLGWLTMDDHRHRMEFEASAWRASDGMRGEWPTRLRMADDLVGGRMLHGRSREEVERLLGPGQDASRWPGWDAVYLLGPERGLFGIDSEWLVIRFGPDGTVAERRILVD